VLLATVRSARLTAGSGGGSSVKTRLKTVSE